MKTSQRIAGGRSVQLVKDMGTHDKPHACSAHIHPSAFKLLGMDVFVSMLRFRDVASRVVLPVVKDSEEEPILVVNFQMASLGTSVFSTKDSQGYSFVGYFHARHDDMVEDIGVLEVPLEDGMGLEGETGLDGDIGLDRDIGLDGDLPGSKHPRKKSRAMHFLDTHEDPKIGI